SFTCSRIITKHALNLALAAGAKDISLLIQSVMCSLAPLLHRLFPICVLKMFGRVGSIGFGVSQKVSIAFVELNGCRSLVRAVRKEKSILAVAVVRLRY